ncbi:uncharacterized protein PITG_11570 [Phytophthora infestans T30-4]|uniref:Uncharacterized protein n=1 Tax=Phytophthora infestans (strain T30-4) TaxID=403677 RepID=D0NI26_PHYIT|nr:uncharacterized protein PITG_11570 [Phytophthora infestans T30-4]EEY59111.1 hypothetical protein PITG_11570 [Phytophthora infestans T30-4]|eukprot:XP_002901125.1 hypothetical protein PITG_11570 [Phytophthora infestans T30-4]
MRASAHLEEVQPLVGERGKIKNTVPSCSSGPLESWSVFEREFKKYKNHTHTHSTSQTEASSYRTTKTLPLDEHDIEDVKTLVDARVSSAHITNFLNDRIAMGRDVSDELHSWGEQPLVSLGELGCHDSYM